MDSFMSGIRSYDLDSLPPENELNEEQRRIIRDKSVNFNDPTTRLQYFLKFPNLCYISLLDFSRSRFSQDGPEIKRAWELMKTNSGHSREFFHLYPKLGDWLYADFIKNIHLFPIDDETYEKCVMNPEGFPDFLIDFVKKIIPNSFSATTNNQPRHIINAVKKYIANPSADNTLAMRILLDQRTSPNLDYKTAKKIYKLSVYSDRDYLKGRGDYYNLARGISLDELIDKISEAQNAIVKKESYDDPDKIINVVKLKTSIGDNYITLLGPLAVTNVVLENIKKTATSNSIHSSYKILANTSEIEDNDDPEIKYKVDPRCLYMVSTYNNYIKKIGTIGVDCSIVEKTHLQHIGTKRLVINQDQRCQLMKDVVVKDMNKMNSHQILKLIDSVEIENITSNAGMDLYNSLVDNYALISEDDYRSNGNNYNYGWQSVLPFNIKSAIDFWSKVPKNILVSVSDSINYFFVALSGVFPCDIVLKTINNRQGILVNEYYKKMINHIRCTGDSEKVIKYLKEKIADMERKAGANLPNKINEFYASSMVTKKYISDFPSLEKYVNDFVIKNVSDHMAEYARGVVYKTPVFLVNSSTYNSYFSKEELSIMPSPEKCNGFFSHGSYPFADKGFIVVFGKNEQDMSNNLASELGFKSDTEGMSFQEEGTLWHEFGHAMLNAIGVRGEQRSEKDGVSQSIDKWMQSPSELMAINYGNIAHVKQTVNKYLSSFQSIPERINAGLINKMKSDLIETFKEEFHGMKINDVYNQIEEHFSEDVMEAIGAMPNNQKIKTISNLFVEFFIRMFMRSKTEDELQRMLSETNRNVKDIRFESEAIVPEKYIPDNFGQKDKFILELEKEPSYMSFIQQCQNLVNERHGYAYRTKNPAYIKNYLDDFKPYVHKTNLNILRTPKRIEDILGMAFGHPSSILDVNVESRESPFYYFLSNELKIKLQSIVENEKKLIKSWEYTEKERPISPDEAEETGKFMYEMDEQYGQDWMWMASNRNWYKFSKIMEKKSQKVL